MRDHAFVSLYCTDTVYILWEYLGTIATPAFGMFLLFIDSVYSTDEFLTKTHIKRL